MPFALTAGSGAQLHCDEGHAREGAGVSWRGGMLPQVVLWVDGDTDMSMMVTVKTISGSVGVVVSCVQRVPPSWPSTAPEHSFKLR